MKSNCVRCRYQFINQSLPQKITYIQCCMKTRNMQATTSFESPYACAHVFVKFTPCVSSSFSVAVRWGCLLLERRQQRRRRDGRLERRRRRSLKHTHTHTHTIPQIAARRANTHKQTNPTHKCMLCMYIKNTYAHIIHTLVYTYRSARIPPVRRAPVDSTPTTSTDRFRGRAIRCAFLFALRAILFLCRSSCLAIFMSRLFYFINTSCSSLFDTIDSSAR